MATEQAAPQEDSSHSEDGSNGEMFAPTQRTQEASDGVKGSRLRRLGALLGDFGHWVALTTLLITVLGLMVLLWQSYSEVVDLKSQNSLLSLRLETANDNLVESEEKNAREHEFGQSLLKLLHETEDQPLKVAISQLQAKVILYDNIQRRQNEGYLTLREENEELWKRLQDTREECGLKREERKPPLTGSGGTSDRKRPPGADRPPGAPSGPSGSKPDRQPPGR